MAGGSGSAPLVPMVQPTAYRNGDDPSSVWQLDRSGLRAVLVQRQMSVDDMAPSPLAEYTPRQC
jgi:hypothetical protein